MSINFEIEKTITITSAELSTPIFFIGPCSSSMDAAWKLIDDNKLPAWGGVLVKSQTAGRGRMGRVWQSPPGHIYGALRLPTTQLFDHPGASLILALILSEVFTDFGWDMLIKWPNDLIFQGGKVGGILLESRKNNLVAGVGFNLGSPPAGQWRDKRTPGSPPAAALPFTGKPAEIWAALVKKLIMLYKEKFQDKTLAELIMLAEKKLLWLGETVSVEKSASDPPCPTTALIGKVAGLGPGGHLRIINADGEYAAWSGTVCQKTEA